MTIYGQPELTQNPTNADATVNNLVSAGKDAANATKEWTVAGDLTATEIQTYQGYVHELNGSPSSPFAFGVYPVARKFAVINNTGQICTVYVQGQSGGGVAVAASAGTIVELYSDGVNVTEVSSGSGGGGRTVIEEVFTSGSQTSKTFSAIPQTYRNLVVEIDARSIDAGADVAVNVQFNGDTGANYDYQQSFHQSNTSDVQQANQTSMLVPQIPGAGSTANFWGSVLLRIQYYTNTSGFKNMIGIGSYNRTGTGQRSMGSGGQWKNTAAITSITITVASGFLDGSRIALIGEN